MKNHVTKNPHPDLRYCGAQLEASEMTELFSAIERQHSLTWRAWCTARGTEPGMVSDHQLNNFSNTHKLCKSCTVQTME